MRLATVFEGGLLLAAYLLGWAIDVNPAADLVFNVAGVLWGVVGTVPLYLMFVVSSRVPAAGFQAIRRLLVEKLGPLLDECGWPDLVYLGLLAGVTEEALFRGVLQPWIESGWGREAGLVVSNLLFALAHWITPVYALLAGLTGLFLGLSMDIGPERNLLVPILIHGIYDILAFFAVAEMYRKQMGRAF
jgi:uncharacterized protein